MDVNSHLTDMVRLGASYSGALSAIRVFTPETIVDTLSIMNSDWEGSLALKGIVISNVSSNEKMISTTLRESNPKSVSLDSSVISISDISACCARILTIIFSISSSITIRRPYSTDH